MDGGRGGGGDGVVVARSEPLWPTSRRTAVFLFTGTDSRHSDNGQRWITGRTEERGHELRGNKDEKYFPDLINLIIT